MKKRIVDSCLICLIIIIAISGCTVNQKTEPVNTGIQLPSGTTTSYPNLSIPAWIIYPGQDETIIGIASLNQDSKASPEDIAREFASQSLYLSDCSFSLDNAPVNNSPEGKLKSDDVYEITLLDKPAKNSRELSMDYYPVLTQSEFGNTCVFLFGNSDARVNNDMVNVTAAKIPSWCWDSKPVFDNDNVYVVAKAEQPDLAEAWLQARRSAVTLLADYYLNQALNTVKSDTGMTERDTIYNSSVQNVKNSISKIWLYQKVENGQTSYTVYMQIQATRNK